MEGGDDSVMSLFAIGDGARAKQSWCVVLRGSASPAEPLEPGGRTSASNVEKDVHVRTTDYCQVGV